MRWAREHFRGDNSGRCGGLPATYWMSPREQRIENELSARHMLAVFSVARLGRQQSAATFRAIIKKARAYDAHEWITRCLIDSTRKRTSKDIGSPDSARLKRIANAEAASGHQKIGAGLWKMVARLCGPSGNEHEASAAYAAAEKCLSLSGGSGSAKLELYREWFGRAWQIRRYGEAIQVLRNLEDTAHKN